MSLPGVVYVNGTVTAADHAVIPVFDHGFLYGEGVYETLRTYNRQPFLFDGHTARLRRSAALMGLAVPFSDQDLSRWMIQTMEAHDRLVAPLAEAYIRVLLTRGVGPLTYDPAACPSPSVVIIVKEFPAPADRTFTHGIAVSLVGIRRNHPDALNPAIKSNNLLNNALAMQEALGAHAEEALMCNHDGHVVECAQSNFFVVRDGRLQTAPLRDGLLPGVTRAFVIALANELGVGVEERSLTPDDVLSADEAFITGTTREVTPVVRVNDHAIGAGAPGPITQALLTAFRARV